MAQPFTAPEVGKVQSLALRAGKLGPMREVPEVKAIADGGLVGDNPARPERGISLLAAGQWRQVQRELDASLPWHTRRANVLVDADSLGGLIGHTIAIGELVVHVLAETKPCAVMDRQCPGLRQALTPDARGGVIGRIVRGGVLRVGDSVARLD
jgi:MOSC domain-containing protein YiiM